MSDKQEPKEYVIASLNRVAISNYFKVRYSDTPKLKKFMSKLVNLSDEDMQKLAKALGDEYRMDFFWQNLEFHFEQLFVYRD